MTDMFTLGRNGKFGNIDFEKLRSGITKKDLGIEGNTVLSSIFDSIDNGGEEGGESKGNGRLERNELQAFINKIKELAGNEKLSKREAKNYEVDGEKLGKNKEELLVFLNKLAELTKGVKQITVGNGTEIVTFDDGHTEQILANGNKIITKKQDGKTVTTTVDEDDNVLEETVEDENFVTTTKNNPKTHKKQEVVTKNKNNNATVTTQYEDDGETPKSKEEVTGDTTRKYKYNKDTQKYVPVSEDVRYSGTKRVEHTEFDQEKSTEDRRVPKYTTVTEDGKLVSKTVGDKTVEYDGNGNTYVIVQPDERDAGKLAQKFGCSKEKLVEVNGNRVFFNVGEKVKIPGQLEPDAPELQDRLSSEDAIRKFEEEQEAKRQAEEAARAARERAARAARERARAEAERARQGGQTGSTSGSTGTSQPKTVTKTRKKYDTATIQKEAGQLATALHNQISGASLNAKTIGLLKTVTNENVAFVVAEYQNKYGVSLAKDIDDEWGLDINTVKEHICKKLVDQAKSLGVTGVYYGDYQKITDVNKLQNWINNAATKVRNAMANATETYTVTEGEKPPMTHGEKQVQKQSAQQIVNELKKAIRGWNDHDAIRRALDKIDNPEEYKEVERLLALEGYSSDKMYSSLEKFIKEELQRIATDYTCEDLEKYVQKWINSGVIKGGAAISAQARMAARVIIDAGDGFGTDYDKTVKGIRMIKAPTGQGKAAAKKVYDQVNSIIASHRTFYGIGTRSKGLIDYLQGEVWASEIKYLKGILGENDAIQGKEKAQAVHDLVEEAVSGAGTDIEYLKQAIKAINSPEDRKAVEAKLEEYCKKKGINKQLKGQAALQAILYDECDTFMGLHRDHKEIRKFNEMLISQGAYTEQEVINLRAEQAVLQILEGDYNNVMDAVAQVKDPKVLAKIDSYLQNNLIKGQKYASLQDFLNKKFGTNSTNNDLVMAELAGNNLVGDEKAADVAFRLINNSDFNKRAMGLKAIRSEKTARLVDAKLKEKGSSLQQVVDKFNREKAEYKTKAILWDGLATALGVLGVGGIAEGISDGYRRNTDSSDNMYIEAATATQISPEKLQAYKTTVEVFEQNLEKMKADYQEALDSQGAVSDAVNRFCEIWNIGTTRDEIEARIEHDTETLRLLKLAAKGKLAKMVNGKPVSVSFEEVFKERQSAYVSANGASLSSISNAIKPNEATEFDPAKVEKVANKAQTIGAMDAVKNLVTVCWDELDSANKSNDKKRLAVAIHDTLSKLSQLSGKNLSLADYGYQLNNVGIIVDSNGNEVPVSKLKEIIAQLKQGLSDISHNVLGQSIPQNSNIETVSNLLGKAYDKKMEAFKQEYRDAFGQEAPDSVIESYVSTINTGKTIVNFGAIIGAAVLAPFTGGGSLAVFAAVAGVSMGLNALEKSTDADGYTNAEWTSDAEQALWDGALAALGMRVGMFAEVKIVPSALSRYSSFCSKIFNSPAHAHKAAVLMARAEAAGFEVSSDSVQSFVQMYAQNGNFDSDEFWRGFAISLIGNTAGHIHGARGDVKQGPRGVDAPPREALPPSSEAKPNETPQQPRQISSDGQGSHNVDGGSDPGKAKPKEEPKPNEESKTRGEGTNATGRAQQQAPKTYAQMDENELFAEYQRLNNEVKQGGLSNSEKVVNINKMKEITAHLEKKGFRIEGDRIVSFDEGVRAHKVTPEEAAAAKKAMRAEKLKQLKQKLGKNLYRSYQAVERSIAKLKTLADFNKIKNYITTKFKDFSDVANELMEKLVAKVKKMALFDFEKINIKSSNKHFTKEHINNFLNEPNLDPYTLAQSLERQGFKPTEANSIHSNWKSCVSYYNGKQKLLLTYMYDENGNLISKSMTRVNKKMNDTFERLSNVRVEYDKYGVPHTVDVDGEKYSVSGGSEENAKGPENADRSRGADKSSNAGQNEGKSRANAARDRAYAKYDKNAPLHETPTNGKLNQNAQYVLDVDNLPRLRLCDGIVVDLSNPQIRNKIANLKEGEFITIGRAGDIEIKASDGVSRHHILITRNNGQIVMKDVSTNGNTTCYTKPKASQQSHSARTPRDEAYAKFNKYQESINTPKNGILDRTQQYVLDLDNLPKLKLFDGTIVDLNSAEFKNVIAKLKEGEFVTIGRDGAADIGVSSNASVSRHHILITRHNGKIVMKDISSNGRTYCRAKDAEPFDNTSSRARRSESPKPEQMTPEQKQARIEKLEAEVKIAPIIQKMKNDYADILDPNYIFKDGDNFDVLKSKLYQMSKMTHTDKFPDFNSAEKEALTAINQKINELFPLIKHKASYKEINDALNKIRASIDDLLNVEAKKAEIRKLKKSNGAKSADEVKPDEQAAYARAAKAEEMRNASKEDFKRKIKENYNDLRKGNYSWEESVGNISEYDFVHPSNPNIKVEQQGGWFYRNPRGKFAHNIKERISLNVVADKRLLDELDNLLLNGEYINRNGQRVKVKVPKDSYYKTDTLQGWTQRHDPITMYFSDNVSQELYEAIAEISQKYARPSSKPLHNSKPDKPWIAVDKEHSAKEFKALYKEALKLNKNLAEAIENYVNKDGDWISSAGAYASCKKLIEDYKATIGV